MSRRTMRCAIALLLAVAVLHAGQGTLAQASSSRAAPPRAQRGGAPDTLDEAYAAYVEAQREFDEARVA